MVLTEVTMPIMDGAATIQALVRIHAAIKIIGTSGLNANGGAVKQWNGGDRHFLAKPYAAETLATTIRTILDEPWLRGRLNPDA